MATIGTIDIITNSQSAADNASNITVKGYCQTTNGYWRGDWRKGTYTIKQGNTVLKSDTFTHGAPANTKTLLFEVTLDVTHDANGNSGTISVTFNYDSGFCQGSQSNILPKINRKSTFLVDGNVLGSEQYFAITRQSSSFTHTLTYKCGSVSGTICTKSSNIEIEWIPPLSLASQNTTGRSLSITYTLTTYNGNTNLGSTNKTVTCTIPYSVAPTVEYTIAEANEKLLEIGSEGYVQNLSKLKIDITATPAYGAEIVKYEIIVDGKTYTENSFTTDVISKWGNISIDYTVTDARGGKSSDTISIKVESYSKPTIDTLKVKRCNEYGVEQIRGEYGKITFEGYCSRLSFGNGVSFDVYYKKATENEYTFLETLVGSDGYSEHEVIFPANTSYSYNVKIVAKDTFEETTRSTSLSSGFAIIHWLATGLGIAFGKVAELNNVLDIGFRTRFFGGVLLMTLENGTDVDNLKTSNTYKIFADDELLNMPEDGVGGYLEVHGSDGESSVQQRFNVSSKTNPRIYERAFFSGSWGAWVLISGSDAIVEQGVAQIGYSGSWFYRKWRSGLAECWGTKNHTPTWKTSGIFYYENVSVDLPFEMSINTFIPSVKCSNFINFAQGDTYDNESKSSKVDLTILQYNNSSTTSIEISMMVKGYWKALGSTNDDGSVG